MSTDVLREKAEEILDDLIAGYNADVEYVKNINPYREATDRIIALLPKVEWRGDFLFVGDMEVAAIRQHMNGKWFALCLALSDWNDEALHDTTAEARSAVERAVMQAMYGEQA